MVREETWRRVARREALHAQNARCAYCKRPLRPDEATADHVIPRSNGGTDTGNICAACEDCNKAKASHSSAAFKKLIKADDPCPDRLRICRFRRRLWLETDRACERIRRAVRG